MAASSPALRPLRALAGCLALAGVLAAGCRPASPEEGLRGSRPNIVLVVLCSLRFDHLGAAGYSRDLTPFLDGLAERGVFFENAVSSSSWTKPSAASLLTGLTPNVHRMLDFYHLHAIERGRVTRRRVLPEELVTLPETLGAAGYDTFCRVNNVHAGKFFHLTQGCESSLTRNGLGTVQMVEDLAAWLSDQQRESPFFAYLYDAQLPALDAALARIPEVLEGAGAAGETLIVVTADHGDRFFEHGLIDHGRGLDEPVVKIPLIFAGPGVAGGQRRPEVVRSIDLFPTLAEIAGAEAPPGLQGRSLVPLLADPAARLPEASAFSSFDGRAHAVRLGHYKLLVGPGDYRALYDLREDPLEHRDLLAAEPETARRLGAELRRWLEEEERLARTMGPVESRELSPEVIDELRALGYL